MKLKNLKIGKKLMLAFSTLLILATVSNFYLISSMRQSKDLSHELFTGPYKSTTESMGIRKDLVSIGRNLGNAILETNFPLYKENVMYEFESIDKRLETIRTSFNGNQTFIDNIEKAVESLKQETEKVFVLIENGDHEKAIEITKPNTPYFDAYDKSTEYAEALNKEAESQGIKFDQMIIDKADSVTTICVSISVFTIVVGIVIAIYITKRLTHPIKEIEIAADKMAVGDFDININYESHDELGSLACSMRKMSSRTKEIINDTVRVLEDIASGDFNVMPEVEYTGVFKEIEKSVIRITDDLSETMSQINASSEEVGSASDQVASGAQMLSQGATEQASAIEELSATIMEISEKIKDTAGNAKKANSLTLSSARQVKDGNEQMEQMVKAMEEISFTSNEIGRIIKTIDDIAFQTNILALNAAVEAARAGSAGKGFAVVADEVRNLAAKSAEAAKNTAKLIENSIQAVNKGSNIVDNTAESLQKIINTTSRTTVLVNEIAKASEEEANAITQVTLGLEQVSEVVQTNSATSEESAAASEELSGQAQMLKSLIDNFKLKDINTSNKRINLKGDETDYFAMNEY